MKIIGKTSTGVIAELSSDELAKILGYSWSSRAKDALGNDWNEVGKELKTDERYEQLQALSSIPAHIKQLSTILKEAQASVDKSVALIAKSSIVEIKSK